MVGSSSAAAAEDLHPKAGELSRAFRKFLCAHVEKVGYRVGKTGIRLCDNRELCKRTDFFYNGHKLHGTQRAVYSESVCAQSLNDRDHALGRDSRKGTLVFLKGHGHEHRLVGVLLSRKESRLDLVQIGHCFKDDNVRIRAGKNDFLVAVVSLLEFKSSRWLEELTYRPYIKRYQSIAVYGFTCVINTC